MSMNQEALKELMDELQTAADRVAAFIGADIKYLELRLMHADPDKQLPTGMHKRAFPSAEGDMFMHELKQLGLDTWKSSAKCSGAAFTNATYANNYESGIQLRFEIAEDEITEIERLEKRLRELKGEA